MTVNEFACLCLCGDTAEPGTGDLLSTADGWRVASCRHCRATTTTCMACGLTLLSHLVIAGVCVDCAGS